MDGNTDSAQSHIAPLVERFVKQLNITFKAVRLYPVTSSIPRQSSEEAVTVLRGLLDSDPRVQLEVTREGLRHEGSVIFPQSEGFGAFAREFYSRNLASVRFHEGATADDIARFVSLLDVPVQDIAAAGGFGAALWETGVSNISVTEVATRIVDGDPLDHAERTVPVEARGRGRLASRRRAHRPTHRRGGGGIAAQPARPDAGATRPETDRRVPAGARRARDRPRGTGPVRERRTSGSRGLRRAAGGPGRRAARHRRGGPRLGAGHPGQGLPLQAARRRATRRRRSPRSCGPWASIGCSTRSWRRWRRPRRRAPASHGRSATSRSSTSACRRTPCSPRSSRR